MTTAYALVQRGWKVHLVDGADGPAMGCSQANGAQLSYCYTDALASPAVLANALSIMFREEIEDRIKAKKTGRMGAMAAE